MAYDELMVRVGVEDFDDALTEEGVRPFEMSGRGMKGWILVGWQGIAEDRDLERWITVGMDFAGRYRRSSRTIHWSGAVGEL